MKYRDGKTLLTQQKRFTGTKIVFETNTPLGNIHIHIFKIEHIRMSNVLYRLMRLHPFAPRERRHSIDRGSIHCPHSHILIMERRRGHLAIDRSEVSRTARVQIISRGDDLCGIPPICLRGADFPRREDRADSRSSAESSRTRRDP